MLIEVWSDLERKFGGSDTQIQKIVSLMPIKVKKRRKL